MNTRDLPRTGIRRVGTGRFIGAILCLAGLLGSPVMGAGAGAEATVLYQTGFEQAEGFVKLDETLTGQGGWVSINAGGNGLVENFFEGFGQQAFVGFAPPEEPAEPLYVFRPLNHVPEPSEEPVMRFSVLMAIMDSTNGRFDDFQWAVFNMAGQRLFALHFDHETLVISYGLDDGAGLISTETGYNPDSEMELVITMNFARNHWTAALNHLVVVNARPITTRPGAPDIGDIDAVWIIRNPEEPGDNFMVFDNYRVEVRAVAAIPPTVEWLGPVAGGRMALRIFGEPDRNYAVDGSFDLVNWTTLQTASAPDGIFDFVDEESTVLERRFYRARLLD